MRFIVPAMAAILLAVSPIAAVHAQTTPAPAQAAPVTAAPATLPDTPAPKAKLSRLQKRFAAANTTHDGHLTLEQARANKWTQIVTHFSTLDAEKKGYVTEAQIGAAAHAARATKAKPPIKS